MHVEEVLARFDKVKKQGKGWVACCPAHQDKSPSMSITETDGKILLHCFAGCQTEDVLAAVGLELKDLFTQELDPSARRGMAKQYRTNKLKELLDHERLVVKISESRLAAGGVLDERNRQIYERAKNNIRLILESTE